jgi:hypothetical protein
VQGEPVPRVSLGLRLGIILHNANATALRWRALVPVRRSATGAHTGQGVGCRREPAPVIPSAADFSGPGAVGSTGVRWVVAHHGHAEGRHVVPGTAGSTCHGCVTWFRDSKAWNLRNGTRPKTVLASADSLRHTEPQSVRDGLTGHRQGIDETQAWPDRPLDEGRFLRVVIMMASFQHHLGQLLSSPVARSASGGGPRPAGLEFQPPSTLVILRRGGVHPVWRSS